MLHLSICTVRGGHSEARFWRRCFVKLQKFPAVQLSGRPCFAQECKGLWSKLPICIPISTLKLTRNCEASLCTPQYLFPLPLIVSGPFIFFIVEPPFAFNILFLWPGLVLTQHSKRTFWESYKCPTMLYNFLHVEWGNRDLLIWFSSSLTQFS